VAGSTLAADGASAATTRVRRTTSAVTIATATLVAPAAKARWKPPTSEPATVWPSATSAFVWLVAMVPSTARSSGPWFAREHLRHGDDGAQLVIDLGIDTTADFHRYAIR
jgi:hypothetical protein